MFYILLGPGNGLGAKESWGQALQFRVWGPSWLRFTQDLGIGHEGLKFRFLGLWSVRKSLLSSKSLRAVALRAFRAAGLEFGPPSCCGA